jgi:hypothetical protein
VFGGLAVVYDIVLLARIVDKIDDELDGFWEWCICFGGLSISVTHICMIQYTALYGHIFYFSSIKDTYGVCVLMAALFGIIGGGVYAADHDARYTKIPECWMNIKNRMRGIHEH